MQPLVERDRLVGLLLLDAQAERRRGAADVDVVDVLDRAEAEEAAQDRPGDRIGLGQFLGATAEGDVQPVVGLGRELAEQLADLFAEQEIRLHQLVGLGVHAGQVHGIANFAGEQEGSDDLGDFQAALFLRLLGTRAEVRREHDVGQGAELVVGRERFDAEHVEGGAADLAGFQACHEVRLVDDLAAGAVDDPHAGLHAGDGLGVDHAAGLIGDRHVDGDEVGLAINRVGIDRQLEAELLGAGVSQEGIVGDHAHPEGEGTLAHFGADAAGAEDAERLAVDFGALKGLPVPFAAAHGAMRGGNLPGERAQHEEGQFGGGDRVATGGVHHDDAPLGGGGDIHVVHAHAGAADDLELFGGLEDLRRHLGLGTHDHGVHVGDEREQLGLGEPLGQDGDLELRARLEKGDAAG